MRVRVRGLLLIVSLLIAGCAIEHPLPPGTPTAMIRFTSNVPIIIWPMCERDNFMITTVVRNSYLSEVSPVKMYGTRSDKNNEVVERLIPADRTLFFRIRWGTAWTTTGPTGMQTSITQCDRIFELSPVPGEQYQADYELVGFGSDCTVYLSRLTVDDSGQVDNDPLPVTFHPDDKETYAACGGRKRGVL